MQRYWHQLQPRRSLSKKDPTRFLAQIQPVPSATAPQPKKLNLQINKFAIFIDRFLFLAIISFLVPEVIFRQTGLYLWLTVFAALFVALVGAIADMVVISKRNRRRLEVWSDGLALQIGTSKWQINWQDVRQFTRYRALPLLRGHPKPYLYELVGDSTSVRWYWLDSLRSIKIDPPMAADEYERWMTQLTGYIIERTGLPLLDLDENNQGPEESA